MQATSTLPISREQPRTAIAATAESKHTPDADTCSLLSRSAPQRTRKSLDRSGQLRAAARPCAIERARNHISESVQHGAQRPCDSKSGCARGPAQCNAAPFQRYAEHTDWIRQIIGLCWHPWSCETPVRRFVTHIHSDLVHSEPLDARKLLFQQRWRRRRQQSGGNSGDNGGGGGGKAAGAAVVAAGVAAAAAAVAAAAKVVQLDCDRTTNWRVLATRHGGCVPAHRRGVHGSKSACGTGAARR